MSTIKYLLDENFDESLRKGLNLRATEELALIWGAADAEEFADQIVYLPVRV